MSEPKLVVLNDGTPLTDYYIHQTRNSPPLQWEVIHLQVPEAMPPKLVLYNGMLVHNILPAANDKGECPDPLVGPPIHSHSYGWYGQHTHNKMHAVETNNRLVLACATHIPTPQLINISRLIPEFVHCDVYDLEGHSAMRPQWGILTEGTIPHAAALDFITTWWASPDANLAPRWQQVREKPEDPVAEAEDERVLDSIHSEWEQDPDDHSIPCAMIKGDGTMTAHRPRMRRRLKPTLHHALVHLVNKETGYIDGGVWFQDEYINIIDPATQRSYARFEHMDPDSCVKAIEYVRTKLPLSGKYTSVRYTLEELRQIARDMIAQRVFFSTQLNDQSLLPSVFMTIMFMGLEAIWYYTDHQLEIFYDYYEASGPRSVNGYPMFMSHRVMSLADYNTTVGIYERMRAAMDAV